MPGCRTSTPNGCSSGSLPPCPSAANRWSTWNVIRVNLHAHVDVAEEPVAHRVIVTKVSGSARRGPEVGGRLAEKPGTDSFGQPAVLLTAHDGSPGTTSRG